MNEFVCILIFIVLYLVIYNTLEKSRLFNTGNVLLAISVALLSLAGIYQVFSTSTESGDSNQFLWTYAAMGVAMIITLVFVGIYGFVKRRRERSLDKELKFLEKLSKDTKNCREDDLTRNESNMIHKP